MWLCEYCVDDGMKLSNINEEDEELSTSDDDEVSDYSMCIEELSTSSDDDEVSDYSMCIDEENVELSRGDEDGSSSSFSVTERAPTTTTTSVSATCPEYSRNETIAGDDNDVHLGMS